MTFIESSYAMIPAVSKTCATCYITDKPLRFNAKEIFFVFCTFTPVFE